MVKREYFKGIEPLNPGVLTFHALVDSGYELVIPCLAEPLTLGRSTLAPSGQMGK